jgi:hypothetical protein
MENKLEDTIKKQHQEDFIDLDAACYYSNIPLSELCSPEQILTENSLKGFPAILPASNINAAILRIVDNKIVLIDTSHNMPLQIDTSDINTEDDKYCLWDYDDDNKKIKVARVLSNETRYILRDKRKSRNRISKISKRKNRR